MSKFIFLLFLIPFRLYAVDTDTLTPAPRNNILTELQQTGKQGGKVVVHCDASIHHLLKLHIHLNEQRQSFPGYRIQIYSTGSFGCNIEQLKEMRNKFEQTFTYIPAYLKYFDPDFKIRVGNYHSRLECIPDLYRIRKLYPASYPVKTDILLQELSRIPMQDIPVIEMEEEE